MAYISINGVDWGKRVSGALESMDIIGHIVKCGGLNIKGIFFMMPPSRMGCGLHYSNFLYVLDDFNIVSSSRHLR